MLALHPTVVDAVFNAIEGYLPEPPPDRHPLGCHRPRRSDRDCFWGMLVRLVVGCSWDVAGRLANVGETTLRRRRDEWVAAGVFDRLVDEALHAYDRIIGLMPSEALLDASQHKAPVGGDGTGPNFCDRAKLGWKWSLLTDQHGIPLGWHADAAHRHDLSLVEGTLEQADQRGLLQEVTTVHLDKGYHSNALLADLRTRGIEAVIPAKKRPVARTKPSKRPARKGRTRRIRLDARWAVERTNSWMTNFGQLRRNTDRDPRHRTAQLNFAIALILTVKLHKWAKRWNT